MLIQTFVESPLDNNNYLVISGQEAALIDCSAPDPAILSFIQDNGARLKYILLTHGHFDHILGIDFFKQRTEAQVGLHPADRDLVAHINDWTERILGQACPPIPSIDFDLDEKNVLSLGTEEIKVIATPGHTPGGVCFLIGNDLFSGDTLFRGTHGRVDLPGSCVSQMQASLEKLAALSPEIRVYPGHGPATSLATEKQWID